LYGAIIDRLEFSRNPVTLKILNWHTARTKAIVAYILSVSRGFYG